MAIAQRQPARVYPRPSARPARTVAARPSRAPMERPRYPAKPRAKSAACRVPYESLFCALVLAAVLVTYLTGYAQMTGANYERVRLNRQLQSLQAQHQLLNSALIAGRDKERIEQWAAGRSMVRPQGAVIVEIGAQKGQQVP